MTEDLTHAVAMLDRGEYTCVLVKGDKILTSTARGVRPLLDWLDGKADLAGFSAADKVVGKAAAMLYRLLRVHQVYARVISRSALGILQRGGIGVQWETLVEHIQNRDKTGFCPMEQAVWTLDDPADGLKAIRETLEKLKR